MGNQTCVWEMGGEEVDQLRIESIIVSVRSGCKVGQASCKKINTFCHCKGRCEQRSFVVIKVRATIYLAGYAS